MKVSYKKMFSKLKENGIRQIDFKKDAGINSNTLQKLLHGENVTTDIICRICDYFQCMPDEIMEWIPDADYEKRKQEKDKIAAQMAELQKKLENLN